ncbi:midnolin homolog isoform X3 [Aethina tumida]|uniref:midnolin homolog isoform X3 n=1 Tax=Aethina tumida TaxID=116153 RepID=UPI00096AFA1A|nr:midnolin homolog isoform X3 [Aethina tumida]
MDQTSESTTNPINQGCGQHPNISLHVSPTTGGDFYLNVEPDVSVDNLKKLVSKRLKLPRDRISLLFRDKQLLDGNLMQHGISHGSRITLLPNIETGLMGGYISNKSRIHCRTPRPEYGIMQALESLNDSQVNEFLCGKAPLNLSMRLGDHMMLIQLQLSSVAAAASSSSAPSSSRDQHQQDHHQTHHHHHNHPVGHQHQRMADREPRPHHQDDGNSDSHSARNTTSLLQASRNLQHTLRRLSADVFSGPSGRSRRESIYSGTFSGALNPGLQDSRGRPRRDVSTIVHILNDLLCSVPELRRVTRTVRPEEPPTNPSSSTSSAREESEPAPSTSSSDDHTQRTRGKLEQLRLVMGQKRERRRQRKQKPYALPTPQADSDTVTA